jgi:hypothetical protein
MVGNISNNNTGHSIIHGSNHFHQIGNIRDRDNVQ